MIPRTTVPEEMGRRIDVLLVDDHALFREGLSSLLSRQPDIQVVGEARDGLEALVMAQELHPDLILMDVTMPGCDGLEATRLIHRVLPEVKIVMLTVHDDDDRLFEAIRNGAIGYLEKSTTSGTLIPMLRAAMRGEAAISGTMAARILREFSNLGWPTDRPHEQDTIDLTGRERDVLELIAQGAMDKEIAAKLTISLSTVKTHVRNILAKLHATSRYQAADYALREGLIRTTDGKLSHGPVCDV
jgi:DNA-binding NarL/FixJ family response regulator